MNKNQHVTLRPDRNWQVKGEKNIRATKITKTQKEAIEIGREIAKNQKSELIIHGMDNRFRDRASYGNDPYPPKGWGQKRGII